MLMASGRGMKWVVGVLATTALLVMATPTLAQQPPEATSLEQQFDNAFQHMLRDPSNLDNTFKYAELAIRVGDYEAAISALERMLLFNPNLPRVRLELGVLYFRLGSYAISRTYLERAVEGDDVPDDVRARVATYLAEIDKRTSRHRFSGSIYAGARYQTNANAGPSRSAITLLDNNNVQLGGEFTRKNDWNIFASGSLRYTYDPQLQTGEVMQADLLLYDADQFEQGQLDLIFIELKVGPRAQLWPEMIEGLSFRPYVVGQHVRLDQRTYYNGVGAGVSLAKQFSPLVSGEASFQQLFKNYESTARRPTSSQQTGYETELRLNVNFAVAPNGILGFGGGVREETAAVKLFENIEYQLSASYTMSYLLPIEGLTSERWTSSFAVTRTWTDYKNNDPTISPTGDKRYDKEWNFSLLTSVPLSESWALIGSLQQTWVNSNFKNFTYNNSSASLGASWRF
jgi:tetratricopeptide (TPR) repeat protein